MEVYGYARVSTKSQRLERQLNNINKSYPNVLKIFTDKFSGRSIERREDFKKLLPLIDAKPNKEGITVVFDSVSRMSRNAEESFGIYEELFSKGVNLVFLNEPHINTETYKKSLSNSVFLTNTKADIILKAVNEYLLEVAREQIRIAFEQSEKEVMDIRSRVSQGMQTTKKNNLFLPLDAQKQIGQKKGSKLTTKKSVEMKEIILKKSKDFNGSMNDIDLMKVTSLSRNTFYKYKGELREEGF